MSVSVKVTFSGANKHLAVKAGDAPVDYVGPTETDDDVTSKTYGIPDDQMVIIGPVSDVVPAPTTTQAP